MGGKWLCGEMTKGKTSWGKWQKWYGGNGYGGGEMTRHRNYLLKLA